VVSPLCAFFKRGKETPLPERIYKLQPDRTVYLRGFNSFAAAASIHNASPTGFEVSGAFLDPADFAVAVLYDADNYFEHPSIKYLPDFNFSGLTLDFSLLYTDSLQPIDSPKYNWIDWATFDVIRADGTTANIPLFDNATLADSTFPAASATVNVVANSPQPGDRLTLWYENLAFDFTVPGGTGGSATIFAGSSASISVGSATYTYSVTTPGGITGAQLVEGLAPIANADPRVAFTYTPGDNVINFSSKVNTGGTVDVSGYNLWLTTQSSDAFIAAAIAAQINNYNWVVANTTHGLLASVSGAAITVTAARYGAVNVSGTSVSWVSGTKFAGLTPGASIVISGVACSVESIQSPILLTLTTAGATASNAPYVAPRGGRDGNMISLYTLATSPTTLAFDQSQIPLTGGSSTVTWNISLDFTALGIDSIRQCWLTFAPSLTNGSAFTTAEWQATFSNWRLNEADGSDSVKALQVAGPGSIRIEETDAACSFTANWSQESGFYSKYFANAASLLNESVTVIYTCQSIHNLFLGTSLYGATSSGTGMVLVENTQYNPLIDGTFYSDRGVAGITLNGDTETLLDCRVNTGSALITRRLLRTAVAAGTHTVTIRVQQAGFVYFDFLEAAVLSDVPDALAPVANVSPALDFDTDHTYKLPPARLMWILDQLGYAGPMNEYLGVFWWNQRTASGGSMSTAQVIFSGTFAYGDFIVLIFDPPGGAQLRKDIYPTDTLGTIANHFAAYINSSQTGVWASATSAGVLTITGRSPAPAYNVQVCPQVTSSNGSAIVTPTQPPAGVYPEWIVDDSASPPINRAVRDWHADFYAQCVGRSRLVVTSCSMELVNPPDGYVARFPNQNAVSTATGFADLNSSQCAVGSSKLLAYQKAVYRNIAQMQATAGLTPGVQYGEFLWWYDADPNGSGMAYYDSETAAAAQTALGRPLRTFMTSNDDPTIDGSADSLFLRDRLRDYVSALVADIRSAFPTAKCEVLWPYDVNYPSPVGSMGGQLNRFVNLPVEWQQQSTSGLDSMKVEALAFSTSTRNLDLSRQAIDLFPAFGWPLSSLRYLTAVFGIAVPCARELALVWAAGIPFANLWAFDHVCLFNLDVPGGPLERRSIVKTT
jgi:hypothetical protein